jgi:probable selenium-dependent hydroxylase accessory protein YqeC
MGVHTIIRHYLPCKEESVKQPLLDCFNITPATRIIAIVGAGGKTTLMYSLAREMLSLGRTVVTTTTTKIFRPGKDQSPCLILLEEHPELDNLQDCLAEFGHVTVARGHGVQQGKLDGVGDEIINRCTHHAQWVLVEADGAAGRTIKAPEEWEPVIPQCTDLVIPVVGLDSIGKPATADTVFRLERFTAVTGVNEGRSITPEAVGRLLNHPGGALKCIPAGARVVPLLNKHDQLTDCRAIDRIAAMVSDSGMDRIKRMVVASLLEKA